LLNQLESTFLLRREATSTGGFNYEVSHDTMIAPILKSKGERKALEKVEAERLEAKRKRNRLLGVIALGALIMAIVIGIGVYMFSQNTKLQQALEIADKKTRQAEEAKNDAILALKKVRIKEIEELANNFEQVTKNNNSNNSENACPSEQMRQRMKDLIKDYSTDTDIKSIVEKLNNNLAQKNCPTL
jgi:uncharacterized protein HemX